MVNQSMAALGNNRSTIRELFEYGNQRAAVVGRETVFDFSLGNPNVPAPDAVRQVILEEAAGDPIALHGYTSAQGAADVRTALADDLNRRFGTAYTGDSAVLCVQGSGLPGGRDRSTGAVLPGIPDVHRERRGRKGRGCAAVRAGLPDRL